MESEHMIEGWKVAFMIGTYLFIFAAMIGMAFLTRKKK